jgi:RNA polymerase sigma-70 factor (ECF subfamily)
MGGNQCVFTTTHWSVVLDAGAGDAARRQEVLNYLLERYWKPVYCYLRRKGYSNDMAKDLTQDFFEEIVLSRHLIRRADPRRGRFRTFLLSALNNYLVSRYRAATRKKRCPAQGQFSLERLEEDGLPPQAEAMEPQEMFTYMWASALLDGILAEVRQGCVRDDMQVHWELFHVHVLEPIMKGGSSPGLAQLCRRLGVPDEAKAANMIVTVKRRFQVAVRQAVLPQVDSEDEVDDEIRELMKILSRGRAG